MPKSFCETLSSLWLAAFSKTNHRTERAYLMTFARLLDKTLGLPQLRYRLSRKFVFLHSLGQKRTSPSVFYDTGKVR